MKKEKEEVFREPDKIVKLNYPQEILVNPEFLIGSLTPDPSGKPCEGACNCLREIIDNAIDVIYDNPEAKTLIVDIENFNGYNFIADDSFGINIAMSDEPGKTQADLSISSLNAGSKFNGMNSSDGAHIGRHGSGSAICSALSSKYILMSKITQYNFDKSIPEVKKLWESQGPRSKKDLFYIIVYSNHGNKSFEGAMKLQDINKKLGVNLPTGMSTMVLFKLGEKYVPDTRVTIPFDNLNYFKLILKEFYKRDVNVIVNGNEIGTADLSKNYKYKIIKTIIPEDQSKNKKVDILIYFDIDPEMGSKTYYGSVNGLSVNTGLHLNYVETCFDQAIRSTYGIKHKYTTNGLQMCVVMLCENIGFDSQTKIRLRSIGKVKQSDFTGALVKEFSRIFKKDPDFWESYVNKLNYIAESMKSLTAVEKAQKMIESSTGNSMYRKKAEMVKGYAPATAGSNSRWDCELWLTEGTSAASSLINGRPNTLNLGVVGLRGKVLNTSDIDVDKMLENKEFYTIFSLMGLGIGVHNVTSKCKTYEEAYEQVRKHAQYGKLIICTDEDSFI